MGFTTTRRLLAVVTLAAAAALPGCRGDSVGFIPPDPGEVFFTYEGHHTGTFTASGALPQSPVWSDSYAAAYRDVEVRGGRSPREYFVAVANSPRAVEGFTDFFWFILERPAVGTYTCEVEDAATCPMAALMLPNLDTGSAAASEAFYSVSGTVEVLTMSSTRATGTFTIVLESPVPNGNPNVITVSGTFDVPIVPPHYILG
jgi:hypothetical protein